MRRAAAWKPSGTLSQYVAASQAATDRSGPRAAAQAARVAQRLVRHRQNGRASQRRCAAWPCHASGTRCSVLPREGYCYVLHSFLLFGFDGEDSLPDA